jgi:hypothetical protein
MKELDACSHSRMRAEKQDSFYAGGSQTVEEQSGPVAPVLEAAPGVGSVGGPQAQAGLG